MSVQPQLRLLPPLKIQESEIQLERSFITSSITRSKDLEFNLNHIATLISEECGYGLVQNITSTGNIYSLPDSGPRVLEFKNDGQEILSDLSRKEFRRLVWLLPASDTHVNVLKRLINAVVEEPHDKLNQIVDRRNGGISFILSSAVQNGAVKSKGTDLTIPSPKENADLVHMWDINVPVYPLETINKTQILCQIYKNIQSASGAGAGLIFGMRFFDLVTVSQAIGAIGISTFAYLVSSHQYSKYHAQSKRVVAEYNKSVPDVIEFQ